MTKELISPDFRGKLSLILLSLSVSIVFYLGRHSTAPVVQFCSDPKVNGIDVIVRSFYSWIFNAANQTAAEILIHQ